MTLNPSSGWSYYKQITISDTADVSADYQLRLKVYSGTGTDDTSNGIIYCQNLCKNFPNDIRFGTTPYPNTATQLAQWIEESNSTYAIIWVKCPSDGSDTFYIFVGNSNASSYSDGANTWIFYEEWTTDYTGQYTEVKHSTDENYGHYRSISSVSIPYRQISKIKIDTFDYCNYGSSALHGTANDDDEWNPSDAVYSVWTCDTDNGAGDGVVAVRIHSRVDGNSHAGENDAFNFSSDSWYIDEVLVTASEAKLYIYSEDYSTVLASSNTTTVPTSTGAYSYYGEYTADDYSPGKNWEYDSTDSAISYGGHRGWISEIDLHLKWTCIGKYSSTEPSWSSFSSWKSLVDNDLMIYYDLDSGVNCIDCKCSRWDVSDYSVIIETWLKKSDLYTLLDNTRPGCVGEFYILPERPLYYDTTRGDNTLKLVPNPYSDSNLKEMRDETVIYVKNITTHPVSPDWIEVKIEGYVSGSGAL